jgi:sialate O-acetylesterase
MIAPLFSYSIQGVIWYQGESNAGNPKGYEKRFAKMIEGWRAGFKQGEVPFMYIQLANWSPRGSKLNWALLRDEQSKVSRFVPNTLMVVSYDAGEENDLHPLDKETLGKRLAAGAFKKSYGFNVIANGPTIKEVSKKEDKIILSFDNIGSGLTTVNRGLREREEHGEHREHEEHKENKEHEGYGEHRAYKEGLGGFSIWIDNYEIPAHASIDNNQVVLSGPKVTEASSVSYCWADNPKGNLYNEEGFPAQPFKRYLLGVKS